jgi:hypothetical protein
MKADRAKRRADTRRRVAKARLRDEQGWGVSYVDYPVELLSAMVRWEYLPRKDFHTKAEIREGLSKMLLSALTNDPKNSW